MGKWLAVVLSVVLAACGGGGGSPGQSAGVPVPGPDTPTAPEALVATLSSLRLVYADGREVTSRALSQSVDMYLQTRILSPAGAPIQFERVTFSVDDTAQVVLVPSSGAVLTDAMGYARVKVAPANVSAEGAISGSVSATVGGTALSSVLNFSISPGVVNLRNLVVTPGTVQRGQALVAAVDVLVDSAPAPSNSVAVNFTSNCGVASPSPALVDSAGRAVVVIQTSAVGTCQVAASFNSVALQGAYTVTAPPITALEFVSAAPVRIYQAGSTGATSSIVRFRVVDSIGEGVSSIPVSATLTNTDGGITFCGSPSTAQPSNSAGEVSFSVCSGTLPTTVQVRASLDANPSVFADSNRLTVQTGLPTQRFFDISASRLNIWAGGYFTNKFNGNSTDITVFAADRQGNPVPAGTSIVFVSEGGQLVTSGSSSCTIGGDGRCTVQLVGQEYRPLGSNVAGADPRPGRVTVLAYTDGEEYFIDANNNNRYDSEELFEDLGLLFLDKDEDGRRTASYRNLVTGTAEAENTYPLPTSASGGWACPSNSNVGLSAQGTCNGAWDGRTKIRRSIVIVFSGDEIGDPTSYHASIPSQYRTGLIAVSRQALAVRLADLNGNPLPSGTALSTQVSVPGACTASIVGAAVVGNTTEPTEHFIRLANCAGGEEVLVKASVGNKESIFSVTVP